jgi:hypothetical protein
MKPGSNYAPTAQPIPAWGNAPGIGAGLGIEGLKARSIDTSIPQIPLIKLHPVFPEESTQFILKRNFAMILFLILDVLDQSLQIRRANGERAVAPLPRKLRQFGRLCFQPFRRRRFQYLHQLRHIHRPGQTNGKMYVVSNSANAIAFAFRIADNRSHIRVEHRSHRLVENWLSIFRTENEVNQNKREGLRHRADYRAGFQLSRLLCATRTWGFTPGWYRTAPSALAHR